MANLFKVRTNVRNWTQPADSTLLHLAQKENFALFILKGRSTHMLQGVVPQAMIIDIIRAQDKATQYIKETQRLRIEERKKGQKK